MKVSAALTLGAAALTQAQIMCKIHFDHVFSWDESGRRSRTKAEFSDTEDVPHGTKAMIQDFCNTYMGEPLPTSPPLLISYSMRSRD